MKPPRTTLIIHGELLSIRVSVRPCVRPCVHVPLRLLFGHHDTLYLSLLCVKKIGVFISFCFPRRLKLQKASLGDWNHRHREEGEQKRHPQNASMPPNHRVGTQRCLRSSTEQCEKRENHAAPTLKIPPFLWLSFAGGFVLVFLPASEPWGCQQLSVSVVGCGNVCLNQKQHRSPSRCCIRGGEGGLGEHCSHSRTPQWGSRDAMGLCASR